MNNHLTEELKVYRKQRNRLLKNALGKFALFYKSELVDIFDTYAEAAAKGYELYGNVPFLVQEILEEEPVMFVG